MQYPGKEERSSFPPWGSRKRRTNKNEHKQKKGKNNFKNTA